MKGSIRQRSKGSWEIRYNGPPDANGKRKFLSETVRGSKKEAEKALREKIFALESGNFVARNRETVAQFMESWLDGYAATHTRPRTVQGYRQKVRSYIIPCLGVIRLQNLTPRHIQDLHKWMLDKGLSNRQ